MALFWHRTRKALVSDKIRNETFENLPPEISSKLRQSVSRVRRIIWVRGILGVIATAVISILLIVAVDAMVTIFSEWVRWLLWLAGVSAIAIAARQMIVRPLMKPFTPSRIAALIEMNHPELEERLTTVVELLSIPESRGQASLQLLNVLTDAAIDDIKNVSPRREFTTRTVKPKFVAALSAVSVLVVLFLLFPKSMGRLVTRAVIPSASVDNIYADNLRVIPGDAVVLEGTSLTVELAVSGGFPGQAYIRRKEGNGEVVERIKQTSADRTDAETVRHYQYFYPQVESSFRYRISCGSAVTRYYDVTAVPVPSWRELSVRCIYPEYTSRSPEMLPEGQTDIIAVAGTKVEVLTVPSRELTGSLLLGDSAIPATVLQDGTMRFDFGMTNGMFESWAVLLTDSYGFSNSLAFATVQAVEDEAPRIVLDSPEELTCGMPTFGRFSFTFTVSDDFGVSDPVMLVAVNDGKYEEFKTLEIEPVEGEYGMWRGSGALELARLTLADAARVRMQLRVRDNLPGEMGGPHEAFSQVVNITVHDMSKSLNEQLIHEQAEKVDMTFEDVRKRLEEASRQAEEALNSLKKGEEDKAASQNAEERLEKAREELSSAEEDLRALANAMDDSIYDAKKDDVDRLTDDYIEPAREKSEDAIMADSHENKISETENLSEKIKQALDETEKLRGDLSEFSKDLQDLQALNEFSQQEQTLADLADEGDISAKDWSNLQEDLLKQFENRFNERLNETPAETGPLAEQLREMGNMQNKVSDLEKRQQDLQDAVERLSDPGTREAAAKQLSDQTSEMPPETTPENRAAKLQSDLAGEMDALSESMKQMSSDMMNGEMPVPEAAEKLQDAAEHAADAGNDGEEASSELSNANGEQAAEHMGEALEDLKKAGQSLKEAESAVRGAASENNEYEDVHESMQDSLDAARQAAAQEAQQQNENSQQMMSQAHKSAENAAEQMQNMAEQQAEELGIPMMAMDGPGAQEQMKPLKKLSVDRYEGVPELLKNLGITDSDWFKTKGENSADALESLLEDVPSEYRGLVRAYFMELAKERK